MTKASLFSKTDDVTYVYDDVTKASLFAKTDLDPHSILNPKP